MNYTYVLLCADGTLYTGWTNDLPRRLEAHNAGRGAKYTRSRLPVRLYYCESFGTKEEAGNRNWPCGKTDAAELKRPDGIRKCRSGKAVRKKPEAGMRAKAIGFRPHSGLSAQRAGLGGAPAGSGATHRRRPASSGARPRRRPERSRR